MIHSIRLSRRSRGYKLPVLGHTLVHGRYPYQFRNYIALPLWLGGT